MEDFATARRRMVDSQLRTEDVTDHALLTVMGEVPREIFAPASQRPLAYADRDIPLGGAPGGPARFMMKPATLGGLLQAAEIAPSDKVLIVGSGCGYAAAVAANLAADVVALESDPSLAAEATRAWSSLGLSNIAPAIGPLDAGWPSGAPYDVILFDGAVQMNPESLLPQVSDGGRIVAVIGLGRTGAATVFTRSDDQLGSRPVFDADAPPLPAFRKPEVFVF